MHRLRSAVMAALLVLATPVAVFSNDAFINDSRAYFARLEKLGFAGVVFVEQDGSILLSEGYGLADRESGVRWNPATISTIGSITKQFTGAAILLLEQDGKLATTDALSRHFDNVPDDKRSITIHHLLTHTSGIVDLEDAGDFDAIERDEFVRRVFAQPLQSTPGEQYDYSNAGYSVLGAVIEKCTGQSYEAFVRERLFLPQGMKETGYVLPAWDRQRLAKGYAHTGLWGTVLDKPMAPDGPYWVLRANGGIHSTAGDMQRWGEALLSGRVLSTGTMKRYWTPYADEGGGSWYAYGWTIQTLAGGDTLIAHNGGNGIFASDMMIIPGRRIIMFMQTNVLDLFPVGAGVLEKVTRRLVSDEPYPAIPDVIDVPAPHLAELAGTYRFDQDNLVDVVRDGSALRFTPRGLDAFAVVTSTRVVDLARCRELSGRTNRILAAAIKGDFAPLAEAYGNRVTLDVLRSSWDERVRAWTSQHGALKGFDVVGTAMLRERDQTLVRFHFENGYEDRTYVWDKDAGHSLLGVSRRGMSADVYCVATADGAFASWDARSGDSRPFRFDTRADQPSLQVVAGDRTFTASRRN